MASPDKRTRWAVLVASLAVGALRWAARARVPDDYDSIGFGRGFLRFDLAQLQPHFPGYPVYVALGHAAVRAGLPALAAATLISSCAAAATAAAVFCLGCAAAQSEPRARAGGWAALGLYAAAWLPWQLGGAALSDATATGFVMMAFAALVVGERDAGTIGGRRVAGTVGGRRVVAALGGAAMALALGTRASYWPLALSFAILAARRPQRRFALAGGAAGLLAWMVPLVVLVGPAPLLALARTHLIGHFTRWGGTIVTRPDLALRLGAFARGLVYDGLWAHGLALAIAAPLIVWHARALPGSRRAWLLVGAPYAAWVLVGQNVVEQPRHLLPICTLACVVLGVALARRRAVAVAVVALAAAASAPLACRRARTEPAAAQAARWTAASYPARNAVAVFGGRSLRFFDELAPSIPTRTRTWLSEVDVEAERLDVLPKILLITSEVEVDAARAGRVSDGPTFCRDARIDRSQPCLTLRRYRLGR